MALLDRLIPGRITRGVLVAATCALFPAAAHAAPQAKFTFAPATPQTLETVTFTSTSEPSGNETIATESWDFNADGVADATGPTASTTFATPGKHRVSLTVTQTGPGPGDVAVQDIPIGNRPPIADFLAFDGPPLTTGKIASRSAFASAAAGNKITFVSFGSDPDGSISTQRWDLDGDGDYDDATGGTTSKVFTAAGKHTVSLYVRDREGAAATVSKSIVITPRTTTLISPFPRVRIAGRFVAGGTRVTLLFLRAPRTATAVVNCSGGNCPYKRIKRKVKNGALRISSLERYLRAGTLIRVAITEPDRIGSYTSFLIRNGTAARRRDRCLYPGSSKPRLCPDQ